MRQFAALLLLCAACEDYTPPTVPDLATPVFDLAVSPTGPSDFSFNEDMACVLRQFAGFAGISDTERRLDCTCGCLIDAFEGNVVSGFWATPSTPGATFTPILGMGVEVTLDRTSGQEFAALSSLSSVGPAFVDGDFDLTVEYRLAGPLPPDAHALLGVSTTSQTLSVGRERLADGSDVVGAQLAPVAEVTLPSAVTAGTLELFRTGTTLEALADGQLITQYTAAPTTRLSLQLTAVLRGCDADGGPTCSMGVVWHNLRMKGGALVDRR